MFPIYILLLSITQTAISLPSPPGGLLNTPQLLTRRTVSSDGVAGPMVILALIADAVASMDSGMF